MIENSKTDSFYNELVFANINTSNSNINSNTNPNQNVLTNNKAEKNLLMQPQQQPVNTKISIGKDNNIEIEENTFHGNHVKKSFVNEQRNNNSVVHSGNQSGNQYAIYTKADMKKK